MIHKLEESRGGTVLESSGKLEVYVQIGRILMEYMEVWV